MTRSIFVDFISFEMIHLQKPRPHIMSEFTDETSQETPKRIIAKIGLSKKKKKKVEWQ